MIIRVRRVYERPDRDDGTRVLVDRLWPRGLSKADAALDLWLKAIAPSAALRRWFGHDPARYDEFARRYRAELAGRPELLAELAGLAARGAVTLLTASRNADQSHAQVLASRLIAYIEAEHEGAGADGPADRGGTAS